MQLTKREYNPELHDVFKALTLHQPYADLLTVVAYLDDDGYHAEKSIAILTRAAKYRGELLICSSRNPAIIGHPSAVTCGFVELYDVKRVSDFTEEDWNEAAIAPEDRDKYKNGYGWKFRNPRRVIEMPIRGQVGIYNLIVPKNDITEYPRTVVLDKDGWKLLQKRIK